MHSFAWNFPISQYCISSNAILLFKKRWNVNSNIPGGKQILYIEALIWHHRIARLTQIKQEAAFHKLAVTCRTSISRRDERSKTTWCWANKNLHSILVLICGESWLSSYWWRWFPNCDFGSDNDETCCKELRIKISRCKKNWPSLCQAKSSPHATVWT